jgi:hypothetical protein
MTGWHVDEQAVRRWIDRVDSLRDGASVEQHLLSCAECRARVTAALADAPAPGLVDLAAVWSRTRDAIELPRPSGFERLLRRAGLPGHEARLVAAASAFRRVWLAGVAAVLAFATLAAAVGHARGMWLFLAVAPLVPCIAVAFSYDPKLDPALEPELVTPYPALRLVLLRTVGFVAAVLALSTWTSPLRAAIAVSAAWLVVVWLLMAQSGSPDAVLRARFQLCYLVLAAVSSVIFLARRRHLRELRPRRSRL